jgi:cell division protein FtsN
LAQDDYFYEIQLTNKQLVFYFMAGATGLVLSFLAGVMVGRGVDQTAAEVQAARPIQEERIVTEDTPRPAPSAQDLTYAQRLETERTDERLERPKPSPAAAARAPRPGAVADAGGPAPATRATPRPAAPRPAEPAAAAGAFTLQVGAFKDRGTAESMVARLKGKGFAAYLVTPQEGLFNVRVGSFATRADAEKTQAALREQKLDPFVVKN